MSLPNERWPNELWLSARAARLNAAHIMNYNSAVCGPAAVQAWRLSMALPMTFWSAFGRPAPTTPSAKTTARRPAEDLTQLSGIGAKLAASLSDFGITQIAQIAALDDAAIDRLDARQSGFKALAKRFDLVGQAQRLAT